MKLPIRNYTENPLTLFIEPLCEEYFVPPNAEAIVRLEDNYPHSIDVYKSQVTIWNEACNEAVVELVSVEQKKIVEAIQLIQVWLYRLDAKNDVADLERSIANIEEKSGYLCARAHVFTAFHTGYQIKDAETRPKDGAIPEWSGVKEFAASYFTGGLAAYLNRLARRQDLGLGAGVGPFDTDTARLAFAGALEAIAAMEDSKPS